MPLKLSLTKLFLKTIGQIFPTDLFSSRFPVSVKGVCLIDGKVVLLKNERQEWDLPGGKLKPGETFETCLLREMKEELSIECQVQQLETVVKANIRNMIDVVVIIFSCKTFARPTDVSISDENFELGWFSIPEVSKLDLAPGYKEAILRFAHQEKVIQNE